MVINDLLGFVDLRGHLVRRESPVSFEMKPVRCPDYRVMVKLSYFLGRGPLSQSDKRFLHLEHPVKNLIQLKNSIYNKKFALLIILSHRRQKKWAELYSEPNLTRKKKLIRKEEVVGASKESNQAPKAEDGQRTQRGVIPRLSHNLFTQKRP